MHQVSDEDKAKVSDEARAKAAAIAKEALNKRLEEISMGKGQFEVYQNYRAQVEGEIAQLKATIDELARRAQERVWVRGQAHGELDDAKLVDGLTGDKVS